MKNPSVGICLTTLPIAGLASPTGLHGVDYYVEEGTYWMCMEIQTPLCWVKKLRKEMNFKL